MLIIARQVIIGFSITAYLMLMLLALHYLTVHDVRRTNVVNVVDDGLLAFVRHRIISWKPTRRLEYAMGKLVLILSDTQLVTLSVSSRPVTRSFNVAFRRITGRSWYSSHGLVASLSSRP